MIPAARISAAIEVLDKILTGAPIDTCLTNWGRANRFAGSGDRAAIRDLVFDALRCKRSFAALGGAGTGRGLMLGWVRASAQDETALFSGQGHAPAPPSALDAPRAATDLEALDWPDWLGPRLKQSLGPEFVPVMQAMQTRAPVFLRVNLARISRAAAQALLAGNGLETVIHPLADSALKIITPSRKLLTMQTYLDGLIEMQDAASQAVVAAIPVSDGQRVLDYCAGGGGKSLALAARANVDLSAHDSEPARMRDLASRAARAKAAIKIITNPAQNGPYDVVLADVPCSGSGSWRRDPAGKWALTEIRLATLINLQANILDQIAPLVALDGLIAYVTCSLLADENDLQIGRFLDRHPNWYQKSVLKLTPLSEGDGFFLSVLARKQKQ